MQWNKYLEEYQALGPRVGPEQGTCQQGDLLSAERRDLQERLVLQSWATLWRSVIEEGKYVTSDTQAALQAVRQATECARRCRTARVENHALLAADLDQVLDVQTAAIVRWCRSPRLNSPRLNSNNPINVSAKKS